VRAALIATHLIALVLLAVPDAKGVATDASAWRNPTVQAEFEGWARRLSAWGVAVDRDELQARAWAAAHAWNEGLGAVRDPLRPYEEIVGVRQRWRMFVAPHRHPAKLYVEIEREGTWHAVYFARSRDLRWRAGQLDHVRMRGVVFRYGWKQYASHYRALARWIAARAAEDFPSASRVRVSLYRYRTPSPQEARARALPPGELRDVLVLPLGAPR
jgi:hypothetical protein